MNEISDIETDEVILEEKKAKTIMIKGKKEQNYSWFIENYAEIKDKIFITNLANSQKGELKFKPKNVGMNQGIFEFVIKLHNFTEEKLPIIKLIYKKVENNQNENENQNQNQSQNQNQNQNQNQRKTIAMKSKKK